MPSCFFANTLAEARVTSIDGADALGQVHLPLTHDRIDWVPQDEAASTADAVNVLILELRVSKTNGGRVAVALLAVKRLEAAVYCAEGSP